MSQVAFSPRAQTLQWMLVTCTAEVADKVMKKCSIARKHLYRYGPVHLLGAENERRHKMVFKVDDDFRSSLQAVDLLRVRGAGKNRG